MTYESSRGIPRKNFLIFSWWSPMAFPCLKMKQIDFLSNKNFEENCNIDTKQTFVSITCFRYCYNWLNCTWIILLYNIEPKGSLRITSQQVVL